MIDFLKNNLIEYQMMIKNIIYSGILLIVLVILKIYLNKNIKKTRVDAKEQYNKRKSINVILIMVYIISLLILWYNWSSYIITFVGIFSAGLAIAMKDIIINIVGGLYIIGCKPFRVGDRIEINGNIGDVINIGFFSMTLLEVGNRIGGEQSTGRMTQIPNMQVFYSPTYNYEKGFRYIWHEISIYLTLESDWEKAKDILYSIIEETTEEVTEQAKKQIESVGEKYFIYYSNLTPIIYTEVKQGYIVLTARYLCNPRHTRITEHTLWERFLKAIKEQDAINLKKM